MNNHAPKSYEQTGQGNNNVNKSNISISEPKEHSNPEIKGSFSNHCGSYHRSAENAFAQENICAKNVEIETHIPCQNERELYPRTLSEKSLEKPTTKSWKESEIKEICTAIPWPKTSSQEMHNLLTRASSDHSPLEEEKYKEKGLGGKTDSRKNYRGYKNLKDEEESPNNNIPELFNVTPQILPLEIEPVDHLDNQVQDISPNYQLTVQNLTESRSHNVTETEAKLYLFRNMVFFVTRAVASILLLFIMKSAISSSAIFLLAYSYLTFLFIERLVCRYYLKQQEDWMKKEHCLIVAKVFTHIFALVTIQLKISFSISYTIFIAPLLMIITMWLYYKKSQAPTDRKNNEFSMQFFYTIQTLMVVLKIEKVLDIELSWNIIFIPCWVYVGKLALYLTAYMFSFVSIVQTKLSPQNEHQANNFTSNILGIFWCCFYYGLGIMSLITLLMICNQDELGLDIIAAFAYVNLISNVIIILYSIVTFKGLVKFIKEYSPMFNFLIYTRNTNYPEYKSQIQPISFRVKQTKDYFLKISSTYFLPLNLDSVARTPKGKRKVKKSPFTLDEKFNTPSHNKLNKESKVLITEELRGFKEDLDEKFGRLSNPSTPNQLTKRQKTKSIYDMPPPTTFRMATDEIVNFNLTTGHIGKEHTTNLVKAPVQGLEEDNLCYLCYEKVPDAVLMNCGHGGICYDCAIMTIKKKNECVECRSTVEAIYKIDIVPKLSEVIKGVEMRTVVNNLQRD